LRDWDSTYKEAIIELFHRVGLELDYDQCIKWAKRKGKNWYWKRTWGEAEEKDFIEWMVRLMKKQHRGFTDQYYRLAVTYFMLSYGWKTI